MVREVEINEGYTLSDLFKEIRKGDAYNIPYSDKVYRCARTVASTKNSSSREHKRLKPGEIKFRVVKTAYPGYVTIIRLK